ncbi:hypothetical protein FB451DRAFT_1556145 [Mycena latifolia]|nr:hypothetical protein FB451DRAFT_1556145 [Mycena latifolia]
MSFISNAGHVTLGDGVYNNIQGNLNIVHNAFYRRKRHREQIGDAPDLLSIMEPMRKRRRREEDSEDGIKVRQAHYLWKRQGPILYQVIRHEHLKLTHEIGSGPGYFLHAGEAKGRAVILKVFNAGPTVRQQLESTVALSKELLHPNVLRIEGISSPAALTHFIAYENAFWKSAEGPLAAALKDNDLMRSIRLGFKMVAGISSGINHISVQGIPLASLGVEGFDIFLDVNERFLISINPRMSAETDSPRNRESENNPTKSWDVFNALCQKVLRSANRVLHNEDIERNPVVLDLTRRPSLPQESLEPPSLPSRQSSDPQASEDSLEGEPTVPPRREYVWRTIDRGQQSLATIASRISLDIDMQLASVNKLAWTDDRSPHRCAGYIREEITLTTTTRDSAVVSHDAPSHLEICSVCHEVVDIQAQFQCICDDSCMYGSITGRAATKLNVLAPGSRSTVKCQECGIWSHRSCVRFPKVFICQSCNTRAQMIWAQVDRLEVRLHELEHPEDSTPAVTPLDPDMQDRARPHLESTLARLEARLHELEHAEDSTPAVTLHDPYMQYHALPQLAIHPPGDHPLPRLLSPSLPGSQPITPLSPFSPGVFAPSLQTDLEWNRNKDGRASTPKHLEDSAPAVTLRDPYMEYGWPPHLTIPPLGTGLNPSSPSLGMSEYNRVRIAHLLSPSNSSLDSQGFTPLLSFSLGAESHPVVSRASTPRHTRRKQAAAPGHKIQLVTPARERRFRYLQSAPNEAQQTKPAFAQAGASGVNKRPPGTSSRQHAVHIQSSVPEHCATMAPSTSLYGLNLVHSPHSPSTSQDLLSGPPFPDLLWNNLVFDSDEPIADEKYGKRATRETNEELELEADRQTAVVTGTNVPDDLNLVHPPHSPSTSQNLLSGPPFPDLLWNNLVFDSDEPIADDKYGRRATRETNEELELEADRQTAVVTGMDVPDGLNLVHPPHSPSTSQNLLSGPPFPDLLWNNLVFDSDEPIADDKYGKRATRETNEELELKVRPADRRHLLSGPPFPDLLWNSDEPIADDKYGKRAPREINEELELEADRQTAVAKVKEHFTVYCETG